MQTIEPNDIGLSLVATWSDLSAAGPLVDQLDKAGVRYECQQIPHLLNWHGGESYLVFYDSPKTGKPTTVLCTPIRYDIDAFAEDYFYFVGMTQAAALEIGEAGWLTRYDRCCELCGRKKPFELRSYREGKASTEGGETAG
jgi:hypothetical protein